MHSSYIESCACNGAKPKPLAGVGFFYRNNLLASMISHRDKVRYLVAPAYFGKTVLVGSYADAVFDCYDTFWMNGKAVSFLRDLDDGTLERDLLRIAGKGGLAVIDDVPRLSAERAEKLWGVCQTVLDAGSEVVLTTTPGCDPLHSFKSLCTVIEPLDFLYTDEDFQALHRLDAATRRLRPPSCAVDRIAGLASRDPAAYEKFLSAAIDDGTDEQNMLTFVLLALEGGSIDDVSAVLSEKVRLPDIASDWLRPYVHVDVLNDAFLAKGFPLTAVARAFAPYLRVSARRGSRSSDRLVESLADRLVDRGDAERSARLMMLSCGPGARSEWLRARQDELIDRGAVVACEMIYRSIRESASAAAADLRAGSRLRCALMGDTAALSDLEAMARCASNAPSVRLRAASAATIMERDEDGDRFAPTTGMRALGAWVPPDRTSDEVRALLAFWLHAEDEDAGFAALDEACRNCSPKSMAWALSCAIGLAKNARKRKRFLKLARRTLQSAGESEDTGVAYYFLYRTVKKAFPDAAVPFNDRWEALATLMQRQRLQYMKAMGARHAFPTSELALQTVLGAQNERYAIPRLHVNVFGNFRVRIGDTVVNAELFNRQKVRAVVAVLLAHAGRQLPSSELARMMWPESPEEKAKHNLNTILSLLKHALVLPSGDCPYLYRNQGVVMLQGDLVESDRGRLLEICRLLQCETMPPETTADLFDEMRSVYSGDLLPGDVNSSIVRQARREWRDRVVSATVRAVRQSDVQGAFALGLAMAYQALAWDPTREDCYCALMTMQARCHQRPSAVETWTDYLRVMDSYGLGPSPRLQELYESILDGSFDSATASNGRGRKQKSLSAGEEKRRQQTTVSFRARRGPVVARAV